MASSFKLPLYTKDVNCQDERNRFAGWEDPVHVEITFVSLVGEIDFEYETILRLGGL